MEDNDIDFCFSLADGIVWSIENHAEEYILLHQHLKDKYNHQSYVLPVEIRLLCYVAEELTSYFKNVIEFPKIILSYVKYI